MFYADSLVVPANTGISSPVTKEIQIVRGVVQQVEIYFPNGCNDLVNVAVFKGLRQMWPTPPSVGFADNNYHITFNESLALLEPPFVLLLTGWSNDTIYPHTIRFRFGIMSREILLEQTFWRLPGDELVELPGLGDSIDV